MIAELCKAQAEVIVLRNEKEMAEVELVRARFELQKMKTERDEALANNERLRDDLEAVIDRAGTVEGFNEEEAYAVWERDGLARVIADGWEEIRRAWAAMKNWEE